MGSLNQGCKGRTFLAAGQGKGKRLRGGAGGARVRNRGRKIRKSTDSPCAPQVLVIFMGQGDASLTSWL